MRYKKPIQFHHSIPESELNETVTLERLVLNPDECLDILETIVAILAKRDKRKLKQIDRFLQKLGYYTSIPSSDENSVSTAISKRLAEIKRAIKGQRIKNTWLSPKIREACLKRDKYSCVSCGVSALLQIDHIIESCDGGSNALNNLQVLCAPCHYQKSAESRRRRKEKRLLST